jgi:outer membrane lipoprotein carrier protein
MSFFDYLSVRVLAPLLVLAAPLAGQDEARVELDEASRRFAEIRGVCAEFVQEIQVPLLDEERTSRGRLCQMRPNLFRMDFTDPDGDEIVADGEHFWLYYRSMNPRQVIRMPLDPERGGLDFYREFLDDAGEKYEMRLEGRETVTGRETLRIHLTPRAQRGYRDATVWIDPTSHLIRRIEVREENGSVRRVTMSELQVDPGLDASKFTFTPPPGVHVVSG